MKERLIVLETKYAAQMKYVWGATGGAALGIGGHIAPYATGIIAAVIGV